MAVPNTHTFSLRKVTQEVFGDTAPGRSLRAAFTASDAGRFDVAYGNKTEPNTMAEFRNYNSRVRAWRGIYPYCLQNVYYSVSTSGSFIRNNCAANYIGSSVTYTVAANTYSSEISQEDANSKAQTDVNTNGQNYANSIGTCTYNLLEIGDAHQGGIIGYLLLPGDPGYDSIVQHGVIAAPADQSSGIAWWNGSNITTNASNIAVGAGTSNTGLIVAAQGNGSYAAKLCYDLILNGYNDWCLPSGYDLAFMYPYRVLIGGFSQAFYHGSTEPAFNTGYSYRRDFSDNPSSVIYNPKSDILRVRAVRYF